MISYLGSIIAGSGRMDVDVDRRVAQASKAFGALRKAVFLDKNLSLRTKRKPYNACVLSVLLYWGPRGSCTMPVSSQCYSTGDQEEAVQCLCPLSATLLGTKRKLYNVCVLSVLLYWGPRGSCTMPVSSQCYSTGDQEEAVQCLCPLSATLLGTKRKLYNACVLSVLLYWGPRGSCTMSVSSQCYSTGDQEEAVQCLCPLSATLLGTKRKLYNACVLSVLLYWGPRGSRTMPVSSQCYSTGDQEEAVQCLCPLSATLLGTCTMPVSSQCYSTGDQEEAVQCLSCQCYSTGDQEEAVQCLCPLSATLLGTKRKPYNACVLSVLLYWGPRGSCTMSVSSQCYSTGDQEEAVQCLCPLSATLLGTKRKLYNVCVLSVLLYWGPSAGSLSGN